MSTYGMANEASAFPNIYFLNSFYDKWTAYIQVTFYVIEFFPLFIKVWTIILAVFRL